MTATLSDVVVTAPPTPAGRRRFESTGLLVAVLIIALVVLTALWPSLFATHGPLDSVPAERLQPPSSAHWFGTDVLGRDTWSRTVHGSVRSLSGAALAVTFGLGVGSLLGLVAGYFGGFVDSVVGRVIDVLLAIPGLLLTMAIVVTFGFGTVNAALAVGLASVASFARLARTEVMRVRRLDFVEAAAGSGVRVPGVIFRHVLPNSVNTVFALAALQFGVAILAIATLGFLGFGTPPPTPEWGLLIAEGRDFMGKAWWLTVMPGLVVVAVVLAANRISIEIRRRTS